MHCKIVTRKTATKKPTAKPRKMSAMMEHVGRHQKCHTVQNILQMMQKGIAITAAMARLRICRMSARAESSTNSRVDAVIDFFMEANYFKVIVVTTVSFYECKVPVSSILFSALYFFIIINKC